MKSLNEVASLVLAVERRADASLHSLLEQELSGDSEAKVEWAWIRHALFFLAQDYADLAAKGESTPAPASAKPANRKRKASGDARQMLEGALIAHHDFEPEGERGSCGNYEPASLNELMDGAGVGKSTASTFLKKTFGSYKNYTYACNRDNGSKLRRILKQLVEPDAEFSKWKVELRDDDGKADY